MLRYRTVPHRAVLYGTVPVSVPVPSFLSGGNHQGCIILKRRQPVLPLYFARFPLVSFMIEVAIIGHFNACLVAK